MLRHVELYFNETIGSMFWAYHPDAQLRCGYRVDLDLPDDDQAALEEVWALFNRDDRPNGQTDRSLSVADVVTFDHERSWACAVTGFQPIERTLTGDEPVDAIRWEQQHGSGRSRLTETPPYGGSESD